MHHCQPGACECGQPTKIDGEQFIKPKAFVTRLEKDVGEVDDRNQDNTKSCGQAQLERGRLLKLRGDDCLLLGAFA